MPINIQRVIGLQLKLKQNREFIFSIQNSIYAINRCMFRISNEYGLLEPYWGKVDRVQAIQSLEERSKTFQELMPEPMTEEEKIGRVHNYRFVKKDKEEKEKKPPQILALQIMSFPVITLTPEHTLQDGWDLMHKTRFRHIPIINKEGLLVGILSDRTLLHEFYLRGGSALIKEVMKQKVLSTLPETPIHRIGELFFIESIGAMPIVDEAGLLIGIITRSDLLRTALHFL